MSIRRQETILAAARARGGVTGGPVLTGVVVALGALFLLSAVVAGVLAATGAAEAIEEGTSTEAGIGAGIALVVAQFLAYLWGGYTAGRMARGAGASNGLLVPVMALVLAALAAGVTAVLGATTGLNVPFTDVRLPVEENMLIDFGPWVGVASLVAMLLGGMLGGSMGARWHTKLERVALEETAIDDQRVVTTEERAGRAGTPEAERTDVSGRRLGTPPAPPLGRPAAGTARRSEKSST